MFGCVEYPTSATRGPTPHRLIIHGLSTQGSCSLSLPTPHDYRTGKKWHVCACHFLILFISLCGVGPCVGHLSAYKIS